MFNIISVCFYFLSFIMLIYYSVRKINLYIKISFFSTLVAILLNIIYLIERVSQVNLQPNITLADILIFLNVIIIIMFLILYLKFKDSLVFMLMLPFIILITIIAIFTQSTNNHALPLLALGDWQILLFIHLPFSIIGTAFFFLSAFFGIIYFYQGNMLKKKNINIINENSLPLEQINKTINISLIAGFIFFTIGLITGFLWNYISPNELEKTIEVLIYKPKLFFSLITWAVFGLILSLKKIKGLPPKKTAFLSILGFICLIVTYIGVAIFLRCI